MQTPYFIKRTISCFVPALVSFFLFSILLSQQACKPEPVKESKLYKNVTVKEISDALSRSKNNKLRLNIYPVKLSSDLQKNDFDLTLVYQDAADAAINLGSNVDIKAFEDQSAWFMAYLKSKKTAQDKVVYGYYIELDPGSVQRSKGLSIYFDRTENQLAWCNIRQSETMANANDTAIGKCPPVCCNTYTSFGDGDSTIGRCPPMCPSAPLYMEKSMKMIIAKVYSINK